MRDLLRSLQVRLLMMQLTVIVIGVVALIAGVEVLAGTFFEGHLRTMRHVMGGMMTSVMERDLEVAFDSSIRRALVVSVGVSIVAALALSTFATRRILAPLDSVRAAARRMAAGSYGERVEPPAERELAALAEDVNALASALDTTEQRRVRLISEVAHELRTPLTTIDGYLEGMFDGVFEPSEEILAAAGREVRRLKRLADDLSSLSAVEEAPRALELLAVDLAGLAADTAERLRPQFQAQDVSLNVETPQPVMVTGDRDRLSQVLTNIIGNSLAYTPAGGRVRVRTERRGHHGVVSVTDTGKGLTPEQCAAVFDRFYRADPSAPGGTGIGLTIARSIVHQHGGEVTAESPGPGRGSTFTVQIPLD